MIQGELAPGQPIRQEALASDLGVSRLPVREALMVLQAEQLVSYVQHRGYVATALDRDDLVQTYRLRELLETEAVKTAVRNLTDDDLKVMEGAATRMEGLSQSDTKDFVLENRLFHFTLFEGSANPRLVKLLRQLWDACDRYRVMYIAQPEARARVHAEHREMLSACADKDADLVLKLVDEHRGGGLSSVLRVFEAQTQPGPEQTRTRAARRAKK
jgi:DNA-binding GntR family transcriptional regulator